MDPVTIRVDDGGSLRPRAASSTSEVKDPNTLRFMVSIPSASCIDPSASAVESKRAPARRAPPGARLQKRRAWSRTDRNMSPQAWRMLVSGRQTRLSRRKPFVSVPKTKRVWRGLVESSSHIKRSSRAHKPMPPVVTVSRAPAVTVRSKTSRHRTKRTPRARPGTQWPRSRTDTAPRARPLSASGLRRPVPVAVRVMRAPTAAVKKDPPRRRVKKCQTQGGLWPEPRLGGTIAAQSLASGANYPLSAVSSRPLSRGIRKNYILVGSPKATSPKDATERPQQARPPVQPREKPTIQPLMQSPMQPPVPTLPVAPTRSLFEALASPMSLALPIQTANPSWQSYPEGRGRGTTPAPRTARPSTADHRRRLSVPVLMGQPLLRSSRRALARPRTSAGPKTIEGLREGVVRIPRAPRIDGW